MRAAQAPVVLGWLAFGSRGLAKWLGYLDQLVLFPFRLRLAVEWADVVHICDQGNAVYLSYLGGKPHVVTCHDLIAIRSGLGETPEHRTRLTGRLLLRWILAGLQRAQRVICVSEQTRQDLLRVAGLPPARTGVVHNALNYPYRPMAQGEAAARLRGLGLEAILRSWHQLDTGRQFLRQLGVVQALSAFIQTYPERASNTARQTVSAKV